MLVWKQFCLYIIENNALKIKLWQKWLIITPKYSPNFKFTSNFKWRSRKMADLKIGKCWKILFNNVLTTIFSFIRQFFQEQNATKTLNFCVPLLKWFPTRHIHHLNRTCNPWKSRMVANQRLERPLICTDLPNLVEHAPGVWFRQGVHCSRFERKRGAVCVISGVMEVFQGYVGIGKPSMDFHSTRGWTSDAAAVEMEEGASELDAERGVEDKVDRSIDHDQQVEIVGSYRQNLLHLLLNKCKMLCFFILKRSSFSNF